MDRIFTSVLAKRTCHIVGHAAKIPVPKPVLKAIIGAYSVAVGVAENEVAEPVGGFTNFSEFFGRRLKPGARVVPEDESVFVSPSDGEIIDVGKIGPSGNSTFEIKGSAYDLDSLLGDRGAGEVFKEGGYMVIYLHPRDYHRVHMPTSGELTVMRRIPGARYPVNDWLRDKVDCIYNKNERTVFQFNTEGGGEIALVMVAAFGVGNIETRFQFGSTSKDVLLERCFSPPQKLLAGDELGAFLLGSTVVLTWSKGAVQLDSDLVEGPIAMGRALGRIYES